MSDNGTEAKTFDPGRYLTKVGASDYLEVKWRLVWLREVHPEATIETELVSHSDQMAIFRARVAIPGGGAATGYGSEGYDDFRDYIEKGETKAIGRALAALGFGTQFCEDFNFGSDQGRVVDSPIDFANTRGRSMAGGRSDNPGGGGGNSQVATPRQLKFIQAIAREHGLEDAQVAGEIEQLYGKTLAALDRREASAYIERLQSRRSVSDLSS